MITPLIDAEEICNFLYSSFGNFYLLKNNDKNINFLYIIAMKDIFGLQPLIGILDSPVSKDVDIYLNYRSVATIDFLETNYNRIFLFMSHLKENGFNDFSNYALRCFIVEKTSSMVIFS